MDEEAIEAEAQRRATNKLARMFPATGPYRRELYAKHLQFFAAGGRHEPFPSCPEGCKGEGHRERCFMAANRVGKTEAGAYETTLHLTGLYPDWWTGKRFDEPIKAWACGDTNKTVRGIVQEKLLGPVNAIGTGMVPGDLIVYRTTKPGIAESVDTIYVRHVTGGTSSVTLKSYQEGRESFQGAAVHFGWADEEPNENVWTEMLMRTMTTEGLLILTFTPLLGLSSVVLSFLPNGLPSY